MEIKNYFLLLKRHKLMLLVVPLLAMAAAYLLVQYIPDSYVAKTQIVTGLVDQSQQIMSNNTNRYDNQNRNNDAFTNLLETMQLDKVIKQVSYQLMVHDLAGKKPFRRSNNVMKNLSAADKRHMVALLKQKQAGYDMLNPAIPFEHRVDSLIGLAGYDASHLLKKNLKIYHFDGSDFINIECDTENPALSAFIVNTLSGKFINYYTSNLSSGHSKSTEFLGKLLDEKRTAMRNKIAELQAYKIKHNILDMANESKDVYDQVNMLEGYRQQADKDVIAYSGALKGIDGRFNPRDRRYLESTTAKVNGAILNTRERLRVVNNKYLEGGFDPKYKKSIDSLQNVLAEQINESTDKYISNPLAAKDNLVQEKLKMENSLELARYSSRSLNRQLAELKGRLNSLVPAEAVVNSLERDIETATKEYLDVQDKYNQAGVNNILPVQLRQLHAALPGDKQPSKKILLVGLSGFSSLALCLVVMLVLFYTDNRVRSTEDLERLTQIGVIGELNLVPNTGGVKLKAREERNIAASLGVYRNLLRNIRFEIDRLMKHDKVIAVTSLHNGQGKTLFSFSLAYAYAISNKKVLLIDGNFISPLISETVNPALLLEDYLKGADIEKAMPVTTVEEPQSDKPVRLIEITRSNNVSATIQRLADQTKFTSDAISRIGIIGNKGGDTSLLEITAEHNVRRRMEDLKARYDVIIIETGSLDSLSKPKEWMMFADKTIAVFEHDQTITDQVRNSIQYLRSLNGKMLGWVLNKVPVKHNEVTKT